MEYDDYQMLGDGPVPLFSIGAMSPRPFSSSPLSMEAASPFGYDYGSLSPIYGSGYSTPDYEFSPPYGTGSFSAAAGEEEDATEVTAHVHPGGQGHAGKPHISLYLRKEVRVDVSANGALMVSNPRQGVFLALGCHGTQLAVVHPVGRVMQNKGRIEIQTHDWSLKSAKMWQRGISFTTSRHALSYLVDAAGARSTTDTFRDLYSKNIAEGKDISLQCARSQIVYSFLPSDIFEMCSRIGRYEDSKLAIERCLFELNAINYRQHENKGSHEWVVNGISIRQTADGFVRYSTRSMWGMGHAVWDDIKILGHCSVSVCQYVCLCVQVGRYQNFHGVPYQEYCV